MNGTGKTTLLFDEKGMLSWKLNRASWCLYRVFKLPFIFFRLRSVHGCICTARGEQMH